MTQTTLKFMDRRLANVVKKLLPICYQFRKIEDLHPIQKQAIQDAEQTMKDWEIANGG